MSYVDNMVERISDSLKEELKAALIREEDRTTWYERDQYIWKLKNAINKADKMMQETIGTYTYIIGTSDDDDIREEFRNRIKGLKEARILLYRCIAEIDSRVMPDVGD